jgi:hypothetical protein
MRALTNILALTLTLLVATVLVGWWTVPLIAGVWTLAAPRRAAVFYAAFAGASAWGALLVLRARDGGLARIDALLSQIMHAPGPLLIGLSVFYPALLAGAAALVAQSLRPPTAQPERVKPRPR